MSNRWRGLPTHAAGVSMPERAMLLISRMLVGVMLIPTLLLLIFGAAMSTLHILAIEQSDNSAFLIASCCYLGLVGLFGLVRLNYTRHLSRIGSKFVFASLISGFFSLALFVSVAPGITSTLFSSVVALLSAYAFWRWYTNKSKQQGRPTSWSAPV